MPRRYILPLILFICLVWVISPAKVSAATFGTWGDQGNGRYKNPVLLADYSDPDVIRVGSDYYMTASDFFYMPGYPILHSKDMVNWEIVGYAYQRLDISDIYTDPSWPWAYGRGGWAPTLRYHDGKFWLYFCTPDEGLYMTTAVNPAGPWAPLTEVKRVSGWKDPTPFWDDDGQAYLVHSVLGGGVLILHKMSNDGTQLLDNGAEIIKDDGNFPTVEGPKMYKRNGYYYIFAPAGGVSGGYQMVFRSQSITGTYEYKKVLERGLTSVNGPHQGAWVETPGGESWFFHFQEMSMYGRVVHLQPMTWVNNWPVIGQDYDKNGIGEPVSEWTKPNVGGTYQPTAPQNSDEFDSSTLGLQWQWNHNPNNSYWSLVERPGYLRLKVKPTVEGGMKFAVNTITQKVMGTTNIGTIKIDVSKMANGQIAGLGMFSDVYGWIGVAQSGGTRTIRTVIDYDWRGSLTTTNGPTVSGNDLWLQAKVQNNKTSFLYSLDGQNFTQLGADMQGYFSGWWKGMKYAIFSTNGSGYSGNGLIDVDYFHYSYDGPQLSGTVSTSCPTDLNRDGISDLTDYSILSNDFFSTSPVNPASDINLDGIVDLGDYSLLAAKFFQVCN